MKLLLPGSWSASVVFRALERRFEINVVAVVGNGNSIAYNEAFRLVNLTKMVMDRFAGVSAAHVHEALGAIASASSTGKATPKHDFERLIGPFDRLSEGIGAMEHLATLLGASPRRQKSLREAADFTRQVYTRGVGLTLDVVSEISHGGGSEAQQRSEALVSRLVREVGSQSFVRIFTLNYDALLDSAVLDVRDARRGVGVSDMAHGMSYGMLKIWKDRRIAAYQLRDDEEYDPGRSRRLILYHLHGSIGWLRDGDGQVWKVASVDRLRELRFWRRYARGRTNVEPVVVLSDAKTTAVERSPFSWAYRRLKESIKGSDSYPPADCVVVAGYGFGDEPLNTTLKIALRTSKCPLIVMGHDQDEEVYRRSILRTLEPNTQLRKRLEKRLITHVGGLPDDVPNLKLGS